MEYFPAVDTGNLQVMTCWDAAFIVNKEARYGQTGLLTELISNESIFFHDIDWSSKNLRSECYSSYKAKIITCTDADDKALPLIAPLPRYNWIQT